MQISRRLVCLANGQLNLWKCFYILLTVCPQETEFYNFFLLSLPFVDFSLASLLPFFPFLQSLLNLLPWLQNFHSCKTLSSESPFALFLPHSVACIFTLQCTTLSVTGLQRAAEVAFQMKRPWEGHWLPLQRVPFSNPFMCKAHTTYCREKWTLQIHFSLQQTQHAKSWQGLATEKPKCDMKARVFISWARVWHCFMAFFFFFKKKRKQNPFTKPQPPSPYLPLPDSC